MADKIKIAREGATGEKVREGLISGAENILAREFSSEKECSTDNR